MISRKIVPIFAVVIFVTLETKANSVNESFDSTARRSTSTLIWNIGLGTLHPTLSVSAWKPVPQAPRTTSLDFGDGRHGAFNASTMANFDSETSTSTVIDINTDIYTNLQFTNFTLPNGYTIRPVGSNPLVIRSLSDVQILGTAEIDCSGGSGEATKSPETLTSTGGTGRCGGQNGGNGGRHTGVAFVSAEQGYLRSGATNPIAGSGGADGTYGGGGGGSLFNSANPGPGYDPTVGAGATVPATAGTNYDNQDFSILIGSAGGGGGGASLGGGGDSTGGSGGAGGGVILIYALRDFYSEGFLRANGGNGGSVTGAQMGGLGGGGGGGTVVIIAGRTYTNNGQVYVAGGTGGARVANNAGRGGDGGPGRAWYTDNDGILSGTGSEDTACILQQCGTSVYDTGVLQAETSAVDLQNTRPSLVSVALQSQIFGASTITTSVAGSKDGFAGDDTGWVSSTSLNSASKKRYVKFRIQIDNQDATNPTIVESLTLTFSETEQDNFIFGAGCGTLTKSTQFSFFLFLMSVLGMLFPLVWIRLFYHLRPKNNLGKISYS